MTILKVIYILHQNTEEWMLLCRAHLMLGSQTDIQERCDWNDAAQRYTITYHNYHCSLLVIEI